VVKKLSKSLPDCCFVQASCQSLLCELVGEGEKKLKALF